MPRRRPDARGRDPRARASGDARGGRSGTAARPARERAPARAVPEAPAAASPAHDRAALALWIALGVLAIARIALMADHTMWAWSLNLLRFIAPPLVIVLAVLGLAVLLPPVVKRLAAPARAIGDFAAGHPVAAGVATSAIAVVLVWTFPDRVRFVGDFLLRQGTIEEGGLPGVLFPQALPLDVALHARFPDWLGRIGLATADHATRALGALDAVLLALLALSFARALALRGAPALAAAATILLGGYLAMFTGYSKASCELVVLTAALGVFGLRAVREGRDLLALGAVVAIGILLHRAAVAMLVPLLAAWVLAARAPAGRVRWRHPMTWIALALPLAALAWMGPRIFATVSDIDVRVHLNPAEVQQQGGVWAAMFAGTRLVDMKNLGLVLSPAALALPFMLGPLGRALPRGRELVYLALVALPLVAYLPFLHPAQGYFRDWDNAAATGVALSMLVAWTAAEVLRGAPRRAGLALALAVSLGVHVVAWLATHHDLDRGLARVEAMVGEPPLRSGAARGTTFDYLGIRNYRLQRWQASAAAFEQAVETAPSPRILQQWAMATTEAGSLAEAQNIYRRLLTVVPEDRLALFGMAAVSSRMSQLDTSRVYVERLLRIDPDNVEGRALLQYLETEHPARKPPPDR